MDLTSIDCSHDGVVSLQLSLWETRGINVSVDTPKSPLLASTSRFYSGPNWNCFEQEKIPRKVAALPFVNIIYTSISITLPPLNRPICSFNNSSDPLDWSSLDPDPLDGSTQLPRASTTTMKTLPTMLLN